MKRMGIMLVCLASVCLLAVGCIGCGRQEGQEENLVFGFSVYDNSASYFKRMSDAVSLRCTELGIGLEVRDSAGDGDVMEADCKELVEQGVDALLVSPCRPEDLVEIVELAHKKEIPVVVIDIGDGGSDKDAMILSDGYGGGEDAADYTAKLLEDAEGAASDGTLIVKCEKSAIYANQRGEGYAAGMQKHGYRISAQVYANSKEETAYAMVKEILQRDSGISNIFAENDAMALGAQRALEECGRTDIVTVGYNGDTEAINSIKAGGMKATVAQQPFQRGYQAVELAKSFLEQTTVEFDEAEEKILYTDVYVIGRDGQKIMNE